MVCRSLDFDRQGFTEIDLRSKVSHERAKRFFTRANKRFFTRASKRKRMNDFSREQTKNERTIFHASKQTISFTRANERFFTRASKRTIFHERTNDRALIEILLSNMKEQSL